MKDKLAGIILDHSTLKKEWEGVMRNITTDKFATAVQWWNECCQKCIETAAERNQEIIRNKSPSNYKHYQFINVLQFGFKFPLYDM
jgi:hypothetical protein